MKYLIVVAHPDDEVLGCGSTILKVSKKHKVDTCILCSEVKVRTNRPLDSELLVDIDNCSKLLGITGKHLGSFPNIELNIVPHLQLVQFIEKALLSSEPDIVITHHAADTNNDHFHTSIACQAAIRLFQRKTEVKPIRELWYMEVASSSEWSLNTSINRFIPNVFIGVEEEYVNKKIEALSVYRGVCRQYPHPRSREVIKALAVYRGSQAGFPYAEAFECAFRREV